MQATSLPLPLPPTSTSSLLLSPSPPPPPAPNPPPTPSEAYIPPPNVQNLLKTLTSYSASQKPPFTSFQIHAAKKHPSFIALHDSACAQQDSFKIAGRLIKEDPVEAAMLFNNLIKLITKRMELIDENKPTEENVNEALTHLKMQLFVLLSKLLSRSLCSLGQISEILGLNDEALQYYQKALPQLTALGDNMYAFTARSGIISCLTSSGLIDQAIVLLNTELTNCVDLGDADGEAITVCSLSKCHSSHPYVTRDAYVKHNRLALEYARRDVAISSTAEPGQLGQAKLQLATCLALLGEDFGGARKEYVEGIILSRDDGDIVTLMIALDNYCKMLLCEGGGGEDSNSSSDADDIEWKVNGEKTNADIFKYSTELRVLSQGINSVHNEIQALSNIVRTGLDDSGEIRVLFVNALESLSTGGLSICICPSCDTSLDILHDDDAFTRITDTAYKCYHKSCFHKLVTSDECDEVILKEVRNKEEIVKRLRDGEVNCLNYF